MTVTFARQLMPTHVTSPQHLLAAAQSDWKLFAS
jgi:hypothetical protein